MGVLWLLSIAIICHSVEHTMAWPGGEQLPTAIINNQYFENQTNNVLDGQSTIKRILNDTEKNMREKRGTDLNVNDMDNDLEKRNTMKFSSWGGKRENLPEDKRTKFSSWGGKRSSPFENNEYDDDIDEDKRARFSSWGGKRNDEEAEKRAKFSSWGGKRDFDAVPEEKRSKFNSWAGKRMSLGDNKKNRFSSWAGKRARFNSWAGKRSYNFPITYDKRTPFNSWAGKRTDFEPEMEEDFLEDKRAKFSSWGGKRTPDYAGITWNRNSPDNKLRYYSNGGESSENIMKLWQDLMSRKRARFSSWAGKRSDESISDDENLARLLESELDEKRSKFSSWGGKRDETDSKEMSWDGKQGNESNGELILERDGYPGIVEKRSVYPWNGQSIAYKRKPVFSSWGGKRSDDSHTIQTRSLPMQRVLINGMRDKSWGSLLRPIRRGPDFYAWGGKRSI